MECVMDLSHFGEVQLIGDWEKNFDNCEGSFTLWGEFGVGDGAFKVSGFQPDFVTFGEGGEASVVM